MKGNDAAVLQELNTEWMRSTGWVNGLDIVGRVQARSDIYSWWTRLWTLEGNIDRTLLGELCRRPGYARDGQAVNSQRLTNARAYIGCARWEPKDL